MQAELAQILLLLGTTVAVILAFQRLRIPSSLGYLLVGVLFGPHTAGPAVDAPQIRALAEFGVVFLLFTIGLNFSLPQIHALRHQVLGLGTGQVVLTTVVVGLVAWLLGLPVAAAFVVGAAFAQSSTTVITKQLHEQGEENTRHGRLGTAMSVFQDVTAAPFVVVIPVLGAAAAANHVAASLGWALAKAVAAFAIVFFVGRWLLRPMFHVVAERRSAELFTLTVLFVSLVAGWTTSSLGLSMAFGSFLAGMMLGETEFRHQVESAIRPFRDVLLGLFFIGIGTLFDPSSIPAIWEWALAGALVLLIVKTLLVAGLVRWSGIEAVTAWRTALLLAVGGEFGFALLSIALSAQAIDPETGQIVLTSILLSIILAPVLIRYNRSIAERLATSAPPPAIDAPQVIMEATGHFQDHVVICGYGRIGQNVAHFLNEEKIPYVALDLDAARVKEAHAAGEPVYYGDSAEQDILEAVGVGSARLLLISHEDVAAALKTLHHARNLRPDLPVMVRTRDESHVVQLREAGASEVVPETLEAGLMIALQALLLLKVPLPRVMRRMQEQRASRYRSLREFFRGDALAETSEDQGNERLHPIVLRADSPAVGYALKDFQCEGVQVTALVRKGERRMDPSRATRLQAGDALVLFGTVEDLRRAEKNLLG